MGISMEYAMGWFVSELGQKEFVWHGGTLPDFGAYMGLIPEQKIGLVLLFNACHHWMNPVLAEVGTGAIALLAGEKYKPTPFLRLLTWMMRGQLLIPLLQIAEVAATLSRLRTWQLDPEHRPGNNLAWGLHILLPSINLLVAPSLRSILSNRRGYLRLYMPDYYWIAKICGSFSLVWSFLRTVLILKTWRKAFLSHQDVRRPPPDP
jgi:hypothetical protein